MKLAERCSIIRASKDDSYVPIFWCFNGFSIDFTLSSLKTQLSEQENKTIPSSTSLQLARLQSTVKALTPKTISRSSQVFESFNDIAKAALALEFKPFQATVIKLESQRVFNSQIFNTDRITKISSLVIEETPSKSIPIRNKLMGLFLGDIKPLEPFSLPNLRNVAVCSSARGWLNVQNPGILLRRTWKKKYFILSGTTLYRFSGDSPDQSAVELVSINPDTSVTIDQSSRHLLSIISPGLSNPLVLRAENANELNYWLSSFELAIKKNTSSKPISHCSVYLPPINYSSLLAN